MDFTMKATGGPRPRPILLPLADVISRERGQPTPGPRPRWICPFHDDHNPSLTLTPDGAHFKCWACEAYGDAIDFIRRLNPTMTYAEAVAYLTGGPPPSGKARPRPRPAPRVEARPPAAADPWGMPPEAAAALVADAESRLWSPEGAEALAYLTGPRMLRPETIRAARLGYAAIIRYRSKRGFPAEVRGWVIPWFSAGRLAYIKVRRRNEDGDPRYKGVFDAGGPPVRLFPGPEAVRPGRPLVIVEGEFEALFLGQAMGELAAVVTLGSAGECGRPTPAILGALLSAWPWFVALDADDAGEKAAAAWSALCPEARRVRPPEPFKDWTEAAAGPEGTRCAGVDLIRWWGDILAGRSDPPTFTWDDLARMRWGPALDDDEPGIIIDRPDPARMLAALRAAVEAPAG